MAIYPGAVFKPTSWGGRVRRNKQGRGILHVAVSNAKSLPPWNGNTWHFYIAKAAPDGSTDGSGGPAYCEQYVDTELRAATSGDANDDALGIETAGAAGPTHHNAEKWTRAQELRIADIMRWEAAQPGGAPLEVLPDARPGRRGWGPHRLGIKHSGGPRPGWWQPGSEVWSSVLGKECPGDAKVAQIPGIVQLARSGAAPAPEPEDDDMAGVFITDGGPWWLYDGYRRRYVRPGEPALLEKLGLVKDKDNIKKVTSADLARIPQDPVDPIDETKLAAELAKGLQPQPPVA